MADYTQTNDNESAQSEHEDILIGIKAITFGEKATTTHQREPDDNKTNKLGFYENLISEIQRKFDLIDAEVNKLNADRPELTCEQLEHLIAICAQNDFYRFDELKDYFVMCKEDFKYRMRENVVHAFADWPVCYREFRILEHIRRDLDKMLRIIRREEEPSDAVSEDEENMDSDLERNSWGRRAASLSSKLKDEPKKGYFAPRIETTPLIPIVSLDHQEIYNDDSGDETEVEEDQQMLDGRCSNSTDGSQSTSP